MFGLPFKYSIRIHKVSFQLLKLNDAIRMLFPLGYIDGSLAFFVNDLKQVSATVRTQDNEAFRGVILSTLVQHRIPILLLMQEIDVITY